MPRKVSFLISLVILISLAFTQIVYAQPTTGLNAPYGPRVNDLKNKADIVENLQKIEKLRANLTVVNINGNSTQEQLKSINKDLDYYIEQFNEIDKNLEKHIITYKESFPDVFFADEISFVAKSYIISIREQQNLIRALQDNNEGAKQLFYSDYLIPVYFYLNLADNMVSYIEAYFVIT